MTAGDPPTTAPDRARGPGSELRAFLDRIRAGDEQAARELLARYEAQVRLVVRRQLPRLLRSRFDSLDFLQSVWASFFVRFARARSSSRTRVTSSRSSPRWRRTRSSTSTDAPSAGSRTCIARNRFASAGRLPGSSIADQDTASELAEANEAFGRLRDLLPADRREILGLKVEGLSSREIGERLGLSERTVRRALEDLRRRAEASDMTED